MPRAAACAVVGSPGSSAIGAAESDPSLMISKFFFFTLKLESLMS